MIEEAKRLFKLFAAISIVNICGILSIYTVNFNDINYIMIPEVLVLTLGIVIGIIVLVRKEKGLSANIGIGFLLLSILGFIRVMIIAVDINYCDNLIYKCLVDVTAILEVSIIFLSLIFNKLKIRQLCIFIYFLFIELVLFGVIFIMRYQLKISHSAYEWENIIKCILHLMSFFTIIWLVRLGNEYNRKINISVNLIIYLFIINIYIIINRYNIEDNFYFIFSSFVKCFACFVLYEALSRRIIEQSYFEKEVELKKFNKKFERLNIMLKRKNNILTELKIIRSRNNKRYLEILSSLKDGIMIFHFGELYFLNNFIENILKEMYSIDYKNYNLEKLIKLILNDKNSYILDCGTSGEDHVILKYLIKPKNYNKEYELYIIELNSKDKIIFLKDITDIKRYYEIKKEYDYCIQKEKIKNEFYSNVSHELRTPINVISSALQLNEWYIKEDKIDSISPNILKIKQNCLRLIRTINNFIDSNKISEGYLTPIKYNYNIVEVLENVANASIKYIDKIDNKLIFDTEEEVITVPIDKDMIERVILNLLSNSVKYGRNGKKIKIKIRRSINKDFVLIELENSSELICPNTEPYLFEEFTKINKEYNRKKEGSGLGLYLSKAIIEAHDGIITFNSKDNKNIFSIKLPIKDIDTYEYKEEVELNFIDEKVDLEFSDIYI